MKSRVAFVVVRTSLGHALRLCTRGDARSRRPEMSAQVEDSALPERPTPLKDDHSFWKIYEKGETIGRGHFAKVKLVRHRKSGGFFAAKILDKQLEEHQEDYDAMMREFRVLRSLRHENIVQLEDAYESPTSLILVCQLATGGELMHRIAEEGDVYNEEEVKYHIKTILLGLKYMHERGVVHRDLKPENILLSDKTREAHVLIADFGLGRFISQAGQQMDTVCGTHHYLAPELVRCDRGDQETYDQSIDVWGVGLIMFIMLFGYNPFLRESNLQTHQAIVDCKYTFPKDDNASKTAKEMIKRMVRPSAPDAEDRGPTPHTPLLTPRIPTSSQVCLDPSKRITVDEALSSQWFSDQAASDALTVGGSDVRGLMKEWNARRAVLKLTNLRAKGAAHPKKEGDAAASSSGGTGPIGAIKGLMRRGSGTADDIAAGVAAADLGGSPAGAAKGKFARRNSNASKTLQEAAGGS